MSKGIKITKKARLEEPRLGKGEKSITMEGVLERPDVSEIIVYGLVVLLLTTGTYLRNKIWNSDVGLWADCVKKSPDKARPHINLGKAFLDQGKYPEAIAQYTEALRINPNFAEAHNNLGRAFLDQGKYLEAITHLTEALRINPNLAEAHNNLGNAFFDQGKYLEAITQYSEALRINPNLAMVHYKLGIALARQRKAR